MIVEPIQSDNKIIELTKITLKYEFNTQEKIMNNEILASFYNQQKRFTHFFRQTIEGKRNTTKY